MFATADAVASPRIDAARAEISTALEDVDEVDQPALSKSLRLWAALQDTVANNRLDALAVRCWPETFTEFGCAACGAMAMMNDAMTPCACEADVLGALSALVLQEAAGAPAWLVDIVDIDTTSDTAVVWHCGLAPLSMRDPCVPARAINHGNRELPLLRQFPLRPGRATLTRLTQARGRLAMVAAAGEILRAPLPYAGTSSTLRFDTPIADAYACARLLDGGIEHHLAIVYGDHLAIVEALARHLGVPFIPLA